MSGVEESVLVSAMFTPVDSPAGSVTLIELRSGLISGPWLRFRVSGRVKLGTAKFAGVIVMLPVQVTGVDPTTDGVTADVTDSVRVAGDPDCTVAVDGETVTKLAQVPPSDADAVKDTGAPVVLIVKLWDGAAWVT